VQGLSVRVRGIAQGVGFRPFIYRLAERHGLTGWVRNTNTQVEIGLDGDEDALRSFLEELAAAAPPRMALAPQFTACSLRIRRAL